jgi:hypothetical protein
MVATHQGCRSCDLEVEILTCNGLQCVGELEGPEPLILKLGNSGSYGKTKNHEAADDFDGKLEFVHVVDSSVGRYDLQRLMQS